MIAILSEFHELIQKMSTPVEICKDFCELFAKSKFPDRTKLLTNSINNSIDFLLKVQLVIQEPEAADPIFGGNGAGHGYTEAGCFAQRFVGLQEIAIFD